MKAGYFFPIGRRRTGWVGLVLMTTSLTAITMVSPLAAQEAPSAPRTSPAGLRDFAIAPQSLATALVQFGQQSGGQITADGDMVRGLSSPGVQGRMTPEQALARLLAGSGLTFTTEGATIALLRIAADGTMVLDPVTVEGAGGVPQSLAYEAARTEGTKSYATHETTIGKTAVAIKDIPQSVSVVTRQMMDDRGVTTLAEAMKQTTGITAVKYDGSGMRTTFQSRGYEIDTVQKDGVATTWDINAGDSFDTALYDRIEVLRGPAGLFQSGGEPGGTINLARKRALANWSLGGEAAAGSWDAYRGVADVTGPLLESGRLRARLVGVVDDRDSFIDEVSSNKKTLYGTVEADLRDDTTLSVGVTRQEIDATQNYGLPAFADGRLLDVDRSTFGGADWNTQERESLDGFLELQKRLETGGEVKVSGRYSHYDATEVGLWTNSAVAASTGNVSTITYGIWREKEEQSWDAHLSTPVEAGGLTHNVVVGADYRNEETETTWGYARGGSLNIYSGGHGIAYPGLTPLTPTRNTISQYGSYGQVRIKPGVEWLSLVAGGRVSWWNSKSENPDTGAVTTKYAAHGEATPYAGVVWEANRHVSLYGSYTEIFKPQSEKDTSGQILDPRIGGAYEIGVKGSFLDDRLNTHLAVYRMEDQNRAAAIDGCVGDNCYKAAGTVRSQGMETEISGSPLPDWEVSAGYAYVKTDYLTGMDAGKTFSTNTPKHTANLWVKYTFPEGSPLYRFNLGGGVKAVSSFYSESSGVRWIQDGYAVFDLMAGYAFTDTLGASLSVSNLLDADYYEKVSGATRQNYYGAPRSAMLALRAKF